MGWAGGAEVATEIWRSVRKFIPEEERAGVAMEIIEALRDADWDTVDEAETLAADAGWHDEKAYEELCTSREN